ncbi:uncharacterized protein LOC136089797 [Hydra vulgaris]|uniref:Uncharacterized protein LOC136089797 n=1 Tax=Hydra vulgaris TaxID=6087 RepID=A0ABM4DC34_HYDVU
MILVDRNLDLRFMSEVKTAEYLFNTLNEIFSEWSISNKIFALVTDSGAKIFSAVNKFDDNVLKIPCAGHRLNLMVNDLLNTRDIKVKKLKNGSKCYEVKDYDGNEKLINKEITESEVKEIEKINEAFGDVTKKKLREVQEIFRYETKIKLVQDIAIRWNSQFDMIESILTNKTALDMISIEYQNIKDYLPTANEFKKNIYEIHLKESEEIDIKIETNCLNNTLNSSSSSTDNTIKTFQQSSTPTFTNTTSFVNNRRRKPINLIEVVTDKSCCHLIENNDKLEKEINDYRDNRARLLAKFNAMSTKDLQDSFLAGVITVCDVTRRRPRKEDQIKLNKNSYKYKVFVNDKEQFAQVCFNAFHSIFGIKKGRVETIKRSLSTTGEPPKDQRGQHSNRPHRLSDVVVSRQWKCNKYREKSGTSFTATENVELTSISIVNITSSPIIETEPITEISDQSSVQETDNNQDVIIAANKGVEQQQQIKDDGPNSSRKDYQKQPDNIVNVNENDSAKFLELKIAKMIDKKQFIVLGPNQPTKHSRLSKYYTESVKVNDIEVVQKRSWLTYSLSLDKMVKKDISEEVNNSVLFSLSADGTTDITLCEQTSIVLRYFTLAAEETVVKEHLILMVETETTSGEEISEKIKDELKLNNLDI